MLSQKSSSVNVPSIWDEQGRTEWANARRLVQLHGRDIRYCPDLGRWLVFDGRRWEVDRGLLVEGRVEDVRQAVWAELTAGVRAAEQGCGQAALRFAIATSSAQGMRGLLTLARSEASLLIRAAQLDTDPWLLNCENGTLDLRTGELLDHRREDCISRMCPVAYDPRAACPRWEAFLSEIMGGNVELVGFLQRAVGMSLCGAIRDHVLLVLHGSGRNGKSTFLNALLGVLGPDYGMKAPPGLLMARRGEAHPTERADLFGKRFVAAIEVEDGARLAESLVKELTGGDPVRARFMHRDFFEFQPNHHVWLATNHKPTIRGSDEGIWRRVKLVPFTVTIPEDRQDRELSETLRSERPGILTWAARGAIEWNRQGLGEPREVRQATADYRTEQDTTAAFLEERCVRGAGYQVRAGELYSAYCKWCETAGERALSQRRLGVAMTERGFDRKTSDGTWYIGLGLLAA